MAEVVGWLTWPLMLISSFFFFFFFSPIRHARWHGHDCERGAFVHIDRFFSLVGRFFIL